MPVPAIQLVENQDKIQILMEVDKSGFYASFNLYWSVNATMVGEILLKRGIQNIGGALDAPRAILYTFNRADLPIAESADFYLRLKGVSPGGVVDLVNVGATRLVPGDTAINNREEYHASQNYGWDPVQALWKRLTVNSDGTLPISVAVGMTGINLGLTGIIGTYIVGSTGLPMIDTTALGKDLVNLFSAYPFVDTLLHSSSAVDCSGYGQAIVYLDYAKGTEDTLDVTFEFSPDNINWYAQTYETVTGGLFTSLTKDYQWAASISHRLVIPITDEYIRMNIKATGAAQSGTVTANLLLGWN